MSNGTLNNPDGSKSSRRLMGVVSLFVGLGLIVIGFFIDRYPPFDLLLIVFGTGLTLLGITTFDNWLKK